MTLRHALFTIAPTNGKQMAPAMLQHPGAVASPDYAGDAGLILAIRGPHHLVIFGDAGLFIWQKFVAATG